MKLEEETADALEKEGNLTADVRPVVRSHWKKNDNGTYSCETCHSWIPEEQRNYANWCLYCGADMGGVVIMMNEYITKQEARAARLQRAWEPNERHDIKSLISSIPPADVRPVVRGGDAE